MKLKQILVIADKPKHEQIALARALTIAQATRAEVHVFGFAHAEVQALDKKEQRRLHDVVIQDRRQFLTDLTEPERTKGARISVDAVWTKDLAGWVIDHVTENHYDLVIKTANKESQSRTPTDWQLLRGCPTPVLLVVSRVWPRRRKILATLDFRHQDAAHRKLNDHVLSAARAIGELYDAEVHLMSVLELSEVLVDLDVVDPDLFEKKRRTELEPILRVMREQHQIAPSCIHLPVGKVGKCVNSTADRIKAGLIVMGTTSRRGIKGLVIGNSAEKVLTHTNTDILALKP